MCEERDCVLVRERVRVFLRRKKVCDGEFECEISSLVRGKRRMIAIKHEAAWSV